MPEHKADFYFIKPFLTLKEAIKLTCEYLPQIEFSNEIPRAFYQIREVLIQSIVNEEVSLKKLEYGYNEYTTKGNLRKNYRSDRIKC